MNVLINAYAVSPRWGSEQGMGWNWIINVARYCNLFIITESEFKEEILAETAKLEQRGNLHFYFIPVKEKVRKMCWNQGDWRFYHYYRKWQKEALILAESIIRRENIDIIHQLNMIGFREPGYLWKIPGIPFVWGPVGGMEQARLSMMGKEPARIIIKVLFKNILNHLQIHCSIRVRKAVRRSDLIIAATESTLQTIRKVFAHPNVIFMNETGTKDEPQDIRHDFRHDRLELLWAGRFSFTKKLDLALDVMSLLKDRKDIHLSIAGTGTPRELERYRTIVSESGIKAMISWLGVVPNHRIPEVMRSSDIFLFTSILEATSTVIPEAIASGLPIVCFDICGFGPLVKDKVGETVRVSTHKKAAVELAGKIEYLADHREMLEQYSEACRRYKHELSWKNKAEKLNLLYHSMSGKKM